MRRACTATRRSSSTSARAITRSVTSAPPPRSGGAPPRPSSSDPRCRERTRRDVARASTIAAIGRMSFASHAHGGGTTTGPRTSPPIALAWLTVAPAGTKSFSPIGNDGADDLMLSFERRWWRERRHGDHPGLSGTNIRSADRRDRLLFISAIAQALLTQLGRIPSIRERCRSSSKARTGIARFPTCARSVSELPTHLGSYPTGPLYHSIDPLLIGRHRRTGREPPARRRFTHVTRTAAPHSPLSDPMSPDVERACERQHSGEGSEAGEGRLLPRHRRNRTGVCGNRTIVNARIGPS